MVPHSHYKHALKKKKKKERRGFNPGSATQLSSMLATALWRTAYKATILQDI
jgi:hypothetical protein